MYVVLEGLTVLALVALVATLLFAVSVVLVTLGQGISGMGRVASKAVERLRAQEPELSLVPQGTILPSTEPPAR